MVTYNISQMNMSGMVCMQKTWQINNRYSENGEWELESVSEREREEERESFLCGLLGVVLLMNDYKHWSVGTSEWWKFSEEKNRMSILDQCQNQVYPHNIKQMRRKTVTRTNAELWGTGHDMSRAATSIKMLPKNVHMVRNRI